MSMGIMEKAFVKAGFKPLEKNRPRKRKVPKCRKCGAPMSLIENTNILLCTGSVKVKNENGESRDIPCDNKIIFS